MWIFGGGGGGVLYRAGLFFFYFFFYGWGGLCVGGCISIDFKAFP